MRRNARCPRPEVLVPRRGNSIVLVMGILVLLVIIATAFITRTQAGRVTSSVMVRSMLRDDNARATAEMLAYEIGAALFPFPVDPALPGVDEPVNSNTPRLSQRQLDLDGDGFVDFPFRYATDPTFPYNFAPYHVVPSTNWPDPLLGDADNWAAGPGNLHALAGTASSDLAFEGNPVGNPGFSDTRWLADHEPLRWTINGNAFSHWRHLTNLARPNNGWRICRNISDITNVDPNVVGGIVENLSIPVEQWLVVQPVPSIVDQDPLFNPLTGDTIYKGYFNARWEQWFLNYGDVYYDRLEIPPNFYNLSDLDADGFPLEDGERPQDEFIGPSAAWPNGTPRWNVNRVLVDTDGDGFTDSFWFLAPTMTERGIRQIVAVRIVDNSAMLNANVATRFLPNDIAYPAGSKTTGATPADLALVGQLANDVPPFGVDPMTTWNVGFYDNPAHDNSPPFANSYAFDYLAANVIGDPIRWPRHLIEVGLVDSFGNPFLAPDAATRLEYWQSAGRVPFSATLGFTPFTLADEMELRMFHGQNYPWVFSRYEYSVQSEIGGADDGFLRGSRGREESSEYLDQLSNRMLVVDKRRMLTLFNGARNDQMPPWLWWRWVDVPPDVQAQGLAEVDEFRAETRRKLDLREVVEPFLGPGERDLAYHLPLTLLRALIDGDEQSGTSYFGDYSIADQTNLERARRAAAGMAANILEWRDDDSALDLDDAVPLPGINTLAEDPLKRMLGMERQPFLVEALIAHVHETAIAEFFHPPDIQPMDHVMCSDAPGSTVVVVQIANPFSSTVDLSNFQLSVFGVPATLSGTLGSFASRTYYAIEDEFDTQDLDGEWLQLLNLPADSVNVTGTWSTNRNDYDTGDEERAIEIARMIPPVGGGPNLPVVIDRIDIKAPALQEDYEFGERVEDMQSALPGDTCTEPPNDGDAWDVIDLDGDTNWIQWIHVTRAWDVDFNGTAGFQANERNPRYVFSLRAVHTTAEGGAGYSGVVPTMIDDAHFDTKDKECDTCDERHFSMQMLQKDDDFEQLGELLNVWMFGHELEFDLGEVYLQTTQTFSEFMIDDDLIPTGDQDLLVNRLLMEPTSAGATLGQVVGLADPNDPNYPIYLLNPLHALPTIPAGARVLDAFVCDDQGANSGGSWFGNANGFTGKITPGLINVNTAGPTVLRSAPHMARLVHELDSPSANPFVRVPEAIVRYRERFRDPADLLLPGYGNRGGVNFLDNPELDDLRGDRGFASLGELMLLLEQPTGPALDPLNPNENWRIDFAGQGAFVDAGNVESSQISTDVNDLPGNNPDLVAQDAEELNLLFAGMSNMLTTRSDVFTVYFRVRSFIQNPTTRVWDATNPEFIVDDSRYVMLVDRSEVNHPNDKPKILYLEKLPK